MALSVIDPSPLVRQRSAIGVGGGVTWIFHRSRRTVPTRRLDGG